MALSPTPCRRRFARTLSGEVSTDGADLTLCDRATGDFSDAARE
jgi:hypothetical protein